MTAAGETAVHPGARRGTGLARLLAPFGRVEPAEAGTVVLLLANLFLLLVAYYLLKTAREPLVLASGGAELKSYAAAFQAAALMGFVPAYSWLSARLTRRRLVIAMGLFFAATVGLFSLGAGASLPHVGFAFFVWVGMFSVASIALFWSYANDLYGPAAGERLFPVIALGSALGSPVGSKVAERLFAAGWPAASVLALSGLLLLVQLALYVVVDRRERERSRAPAPPPPLRGGPGGFGLVRRSGYLALVAALLVLLNVVNTTGEYVLGRSVVAAARAAAGADPGFDPAAFIGEFYGRYYFAVNVATGLLQAFVVSRLVKLAGIAGVLLALPLVALGAYGLVAAGAGLAAIRWAKTAENAVDYSVMNTGKQLLWLPTSREEKYKAKQAVDTFFVRTGDLLAAGLVYAGTHWAAAGPAAFGVANLVLVVPWVLVAWALVRRYRKACGPAGRC